MTAAEPLAGRIVLTTAEVGAVLGCDGRTVRRAIEAGQVPAVRVGRRLCVPAAWLRERAMLVTPVPTDPEAER